MLNAVRLLFGCLLWMLFCPGVEAADFDAAAAKPTLPLAHMSAQSQPPAFIALYDKSALQQDDKATPAAEPSPLETLYSGRASTALQQFGYSLLLKAAPITPMAMQEASSTTTEDSRIPAGVVDDSFILNQGDALDVIINGARYSRDRYSINSDGFIIIDQLPPIPAAGRSLGEVSAAIKASALRLENAQSYVALAGVRQIDVLIAGHAVQPGLKTLTAFDSVLDALVKSGGVAKTGSLRQIKLIREGHTHLIDLYALLMQGAQGSDMRLRDGDKIIIPPIGPTFAVAGDVKRPGIYELLPALSGMHHRPDLKAQQASLNEALALAGGTLPTGELRFLKLSLTSDGREQVTPIHEANVPSFNDGSLLMVAKNQAKRHGQIELIGHTTQPGLHALDSAPTLSALFADTHVLDKDIYPLIGVIRHYDPQTLAQSYIDFPLHLVTKGAYDQRLHDGDQIILLSNADIRALQNAPQHEDAPNAPDSEQNDESTDSSTPLLDQDLRTFLQERSLFIRGAVRNPGAYPLSGVTTLDMAFAVAGGMALEASASHIEVTSALNGSGRQSHGGAGTHRFNVNLSEDSPSNIALEAGDTVRVNQRFLKIADQSVMISGEVRYPGRYDLIAGDKISDLITRAGGLTAQAYPDGAVFSRASERKAEENRFKGQARMIRQALATAMHATDTQEPAINAVQIAEARALAVELEDAKGVGRITVEANPAVLDTQPALDLLLEAGDRLYIPRRNLSVRVSGEVLSPATLQFRDGKDPLDYIHEAGGFTYHADQERSFVLYPDGSAQPLRVSSWNHTSSLIPPGSTIIIPRDPKPFDFVSSFKDVTQILSNLAMTAIFIDDVRED